MMQDTEKPGISVKGFRLLSFDDTASNTYVLDAVNCFLNQ